MTRDELVEKVARRICALIDADPDWAGNGTPMWRTPWIIEVANGIPAAIEEFTGLPLDALLSGAAVVVPAEPTEATTDAGHGGFLSYDARFETIPDAVRRTWQAMLAASPYRRG